MHDRLERWFGPPDERFVNLIWPIIGLPVMTILFGLALIVFLNIARPGP